MPSVSVILPTHNRASLGYLDAAIQSVINQTHKELELLIIDDGSTDETASICEKYAKDQRVHYHYQKNAGISAARNHGIRISRHNFISFLDDDDNYEPTYIEEMLKFMLDHPDPNLGMTYSAVNHIDQKGNTLRTYHRQADGDIYEELFYGNFISGPSATMIHRKTLDDVGVFKEHIKCCEDYELWLRIAKKYAVHSLDKPLVNYRLHDSNTSLKFEAMQFYRYFVYMTALQDAPESIKGKKDEILHKHFHSCAVQYYDTNHFPLFRRQYLQAKTYKPYNLRWKVKYLLSFFPKLLKTLQSRHVKEPTP